MSTTATALLAEELPSHWSTHMSYQQKTYNYFADTGRSEARLRSRTGPYQTRWLLIDEHTGSHLDAPAHFYPGPETGLEHAAEIGSVTVEQLPLSRFMGPAAVIDVPGDLPGGAPGVSPIIPPSLVEEFENAPGRLDEGDIMLLRTGWDRCYQPGEAGDGYCFHPLVTKTEPGWPAPDSPLMELLIERARALDRPRCRNELHRGAGQPGRSAEPWRVLLLRPAEHRARH
jgi:kynurenine formamidase